MFSIGKLKNRYQHKQSFLRREKVQVGFTAADACNTDALCAPLTSYSMTTRSLRLQHLPGHGSRSVETLISQSPVASTRTCRVYMP